MTHRRGRGRPRIDPETPRPYILRVRLPRSMAEEMRRIIPAREVSAWVREVIEREIDRLRAGRPEEWER